MALLLSHVACFKETKNGTCDFENKGWTKIYGVCEGMESSYNGVASPFATFGSEGLQLQDGQN